MRNTASSSLALDLRPGDKQVSQLVRSVAKDKGMLRVAAAYITGDAASLLGLPGNGSLKRLRVLCDPESGNCDPRSLTALTKRHADVRCIARLHAKVYASPTRAVVGSPNLSAAAQKAGSKNATIEAATLITDAASVTRLGAWFDGLHANAESWQSIIADDERYATILRAYNSKANGGIRRTKTSRGKKPIVSLMAALKDPKRDLWRDTVFSLVTDWDDPEEEMAKAVADRLGLPLTEQCSSEVITDSERSDLRYYRSQCTAYGDGRGPVVITLYVQTRGNRLKGINSIDETAVRLVEAIAEKGRLFLYYEPAWTPIDLGSKSRRAVVSALNKALKAERVKLEDDTRFIHAAVLAPLLASRE